MDLNNDKQKEINRKVPIEKDIHLNKNIDNNQIVNESNSNKLSIVPRTITIISTRVPLVTG